MDIVYIDNKPYISTKEAKSILDNCSNTTLFNHINYHQSFSARRVGRAVMVDLESFKKYCKEEHGIEVQV
jgi:hypothetical protein